MNVTLLFKLVEQDDENNSTKQEDHVPEMNEFLELIVVEYQVCYELLHGDNRKSKLVISQVTQITKQGLHVVQTQHLSKTTDAIFIVTL